MRPTLGENINAAARAMMNFSLSEMRLVEPKGDWPNQKAINTASGTERILEGSQIYQTTGAAVADLQRLYATTARVRDMEKPVLTPRALADALHGNIAKGEKSGILFGREAKGLNNDDVAISDAIIMVPVNSEHRSINLAQAVLLIGYEWFQQTAPETLDEVTRKGGQAASLDDMMGFFEHLESELDDCGFLFPPEKRPRMVRNIRNIFTRAGLSDQEVKTLRGIVAGLSRPRDRSDNTRIGHFAFLLTWRVRCIYSAATPGNVDVAANRQLPAASMVWNRTTGTNRENKGDSAMSKRVRSKYKINRRLRCNLGSSEKPLEYP